MEQDKRFSHISSDPKFRRIPKGERKIKIDKRFHSMFKDKKFKVKYTVDKRGRPVNHTSTEDLKRYYDLSSDDEDLPEEQEISETEKKNNGKEFMKIPKSKLDTKFDSLQTNNINDKAIPDKIKNKLKNLNVDYARGEGLLLSESSSDDETETEGESEDENMIHGWGELDKDAIEADEITQRLAVCNMDWDRIRAMDLMMLLNSFTPSGGIIESVTIYPSEYGKQRMKEEELKGPIELVESKQEDDEEENEEGSKYHMEKLRQYQLNRLKYYYAVVVTDSSATANHIYEECNGLEYESSATKLDLRFIPNDTIFDEESKEVCTNLPEKYEPRFFTTTALQQAKVELTWDENNLERAEITEKICKGKIDDISEADLQNYLASSSSEEDCEQEENEKLKEGSSSNDERNEDTQNPIDKYKLLLQEIEKEEESRKNKDIGLEISWGINLKEKTEKIVKKKQAEVVKKTPFEEYLEKRKEKKKSKREEKLKIKKKNNEDENTDEEYSDDIPSDIDMNDPYFTEEFKNPEFKRKKSKSIGKTDEHKMEEDAQKHAELELLLVNENENNKKHFSLKDIQDSEDTKKSKKKRFKKKNKNVDSANSQSEDFRVNVSDNRFSALYSSHHFNIDPTDPHYKKTQGMEALIKEKLKRRNEIALETNDLKKTCQGIIKSKAELNVLVKSVKRKTEALNKKKL